MLILWIIGCAIVFTLICVNKNLSKIAITTALLSEYDLGAKKQILDRAITIILRLRKQGITHPDEDLNGGPAGTLKEDYINSLDRVCFLILNNILPRKKFLEEYASYVKNTVEGPLSEDFKFSENHYENIYKFYTIIEKLKIGEKYNYEQKEIKNED